MDNFLTVLYVEYFKVINKEKECMNKHDLETNETIRNDQSISMLREHEKCIVSLISEYMIKLTSEV